MENTNDKGDNRVYCWQRELNDATLTEIEANRILEQRTQQLHEAYERSLASCDEKLRDQIEEEWRTLVLEKDHRLKEKIYHENERIKQKYMVQLYETIQVLGHFSFTGPKDAVLKRNLCKIYQQVGKYFERHNVQTDTDHKTGLCNENSENAQTADKSNNIGVMAPPVPPPPPPMPPPNPLIPGNSMAGTQTPIKHRKVQKTFQSSPSPLVCSKQPLRNLNDELLHRIRKGQGREGLKSTPVKRSPGGTPCRNRRRMCESDNSDLITVALKKKFKNVAVCSPKENTSPQVNSPVEFC